MRYVVVLLSLLLLAAAGYFGYLPFDGVPKHVFSPSPPPLAAASTASRIVSSDGCGASDAVFFTLTTATVGATIEGKVGQLSACEGNPTERVSGTIDWGDGTSSAVEPGDFNGKDRGLVLAPKHSYKARGTFPLFARIREQCFDHGQSTRTIACGSGSVEVR